MKASRLIFLSLIFLMALSSSTAFAFRCGHNLVEIGDFKYKVLKSCGEPFSKDVVGYRVNKRGDREAKVEHWVYGPKSGRYTILIFEGGILKKIISEQADN